MSQESWGEPTSRIVRVAVLSDLSSPLETALWEAVQHRVVGFDDVVVKVVKSPLRICNERV